MGNCVKRKQLFYTDNEYDEEVELRRFEEEIGGFRKNLNQILPRICIEKDIIPVTSLEDFIKKEFSENFVHLIRQGYFYKELNGENFYDARKISLLLFLLTNNTLIDNGRINYNDKASFIFNFIKTREDQSLIDGIEENEENFLNFISDLVEISVEGIVDCYIKLKNVKRDGYLNRLRESKPHVVKLIIKNLFFNKDPQKTGSLSFDEVNKKFSEEKFMFTSGYIRDFAWNFLVKGGNVQEEEVKKAEEEMQLAEEKARKEKEVKE